MPSILYIRFYSDYLWTGLDYREYQIVPGSISEHEFWVVSAHAAFCTNSHSCFLFPAFAVTLRIVLHFIDARCLPFCGAGSYMPSYYVYLQDKIPTI